MKILHTADWHLGKKLESIPRLKEQEEVLQELVGIAQREDPDVVIVAGDLFDTFNPPAEATEIFYQTLKKLSDSGRRAVVAIAGNHDSPERIEAPDSLAKSCGILLVGHPFSSPGQVKLESGLEVLRTAPGFVELGLPGVDHPLRLLLTPYANEFRIKKFLGVENGEDALRGLLAAHWAELARKYCDSNGVNLLVAHLFFAGKRQKKLLEPEGEKPILHLGGAQAIFPENVPEGIDYVALGHLHRPQEVKGGPCPIVYAGSPLSYSFSESGQRKRVVVIDATPGQAVTFESIALKSGRKLKRKKFSGVETAIKWLQKNPESIAELTIMTEKYLSAQDKARLYAANPDIFIIPQPVEEAPEEVSRRKIDLDQRIEDLFFDYFKFRNKDQAPGEEIMKLFKEIMAE